MLKIDEKFDENFLRSTVIHGAITSLKTTNWWQCIVWRAHVYDDGDQRFNFAIFLFFLTKTISKREAVYYE